MMTVNSIHIRASLDKIFGLSAEVARWPELLTHYRSVRSIWQGGDTCVVEMCARHRWIPVKWISIQQLSKANKRIYYKHTDGLTRGMWVEWNFIPLSDGVQVTITHELNLSRPLIRSRIGKWLVGELFVKQIADRTLKQIRSLAEA